jgi:hypothetical protein
LDPIQAQAVAKDRGGHHPIRTPGQKVFSSKLEHPPEAAIYRSSSVLAFALASVRALTLHDGLLFHANRMICAAQSRPVVCRHGATIA